MADEGLRTWFAEGDEGSNRADHEALWPAEPRRPRRWLLLVLAVLPWLLVARLASANATTPAAAPAPALAPAPVAPAPVVPALAPLDPALASLAALTVHQHVSGVDAVFAEHVEFVGDVAIVRAAAAAGGRTARYAVPIKVVDEHLTLLGAPWALPPTLDTAPRGTAFGPVDDPPLAEATTRALAEAGYRDVDLRALGRDPALPGILRAVVSATPPGEQAPRETAVWLHDAPDPAVLGVVP